MWSEELNEELGVRSEELSEELGTRSEELWSASGGQNFLNLLTF